MSLLREIYINTWGNLWHNAYYYEQLAPTVFIALLMGFFTGMLSNIFIDTFWIRLVVAGSVSLLVIGLMRLSRRLKEWL